jgi:hypothetical protein
MTRRHTAEELEQGKASIDKLSPEQMRKELHGIQDLLISTRRKDDEREIALATSAPATTKAASSDWLILGGCALAFIICLALFGGGR